MTSKASNPCPPPVEPKPKDPPPPKNPPPKPKFWGAAAAFVSVGLSAVYVLAHVIAAVA